MSEKEKKILKRLSEIVPNLPDSKKERLLGVAEGMNIMKESMETQKAGYVHGKISSKKYFGTKEVFYDTNF